MSKQEERFNRKQEKNEEENKAWSGRGGEKIKDEGEEWI